MKGLIERIKRLEDAVGGQPVEVVFVDKNGAERVGTVAEMERNGAAFRRVFRGSRRADDDRILRFIFDTWDCAAGIEGDNNEH